MYLVIEYYDYRKENYIITHGVTSDLTKATETLNRIIDSKNTEDQPEVCKFTVPVKNLEEHGEEYVCLEPKNRKKIIKQIRTAYADIRSVLGKTLSQFFEMIDERVPKRLSLSPDEILTKDIFKRLITEKYINTGCLGEFFDVEFSTSCTIYAIVECEEL